MVRLQTGGFAFLRSCRERFTRDCFHSPVATALCPPGRRSTSSVPSGPPFRGLAPPFRTGRPAPSEGVTPLPVGTAPRCLPLRASAEQETLCVSPVGLPFLFRTCGRRCLSALPSGSFAGDSPGLHRFAEWTVPTAQRLGQSCIPLEQNCGFQGNHYLPMRHDQNL